jgi:hypothetical protein
VVYGDHPAIDENPGENDCSRTCGEYVLTRLGFEVYASVTTTVGLIGCLKGFGYRWGWFQRPRKFHDASRGAFAGKLGSGKFGAGKLRVRKVCFGEIWV